MAINTSIANRPTTATVSNAKCAPTMPSSRLAWSPRDCSNISPSPHPSLFGVPSGLGCAPFAPTTRHRSLSWQKRWARHFPNFSWGLQKAIPSRNSWSSGRTCKTYQFSAWLRKQKQGLLSQGLLTSKRFELALGSRLAQGLRLTLGQAQSPAELALRLALGRDRGLDRGLDL